MPSYQKSVMPNPKLISENLLQMDLSGVMELSFKGGEPMLNSEVEVVLQHFHELGSLPNIDLHMVTNGTVYNEKILNFFAKAKSVLLSVSVDGLGPLNEYIRHGNSHTDNIEANISKFNLLKNIDICRVTSVMAYNISNLIPIRDWWADLAIRYQQINPRSGFNLFVLSPRWLALDVLSDSYRAKVRSELIQAQHNDEFDLAIKFLTRPWAGPEHHKRFVKYTHDIQTIRGNNILEFVPDLAPELQYSEDPYTAVPRPSVAELSS